MSNTTTSFVCVINNKSTPRYDEGQCIIGNIAATLYKLDFGYYCMGFIGVIIFISIFGGIKQNYRWFILNQAIWDLLKCFEFSCENFLINYVKPSPGCFYYFNSNGKSQMDILIRNIIIRNVYAPLVLLSVTRFIALYFVNLYDKLTRGYRIILTILAFNLLFVIWDTQFLDDLITESISQRTKWLINECQIKEGSNSSILCSYQNTKDFISDFLVTFAAILGNLRVFKPAICLLISSFSTCMVIIKIGMQAKFQLKHNRRDFLNSARVAIVITCETVMNLLIFALNFLEYFPYIIGRFTTIPIVTIKFYKEGQNYTGFFDFRLPLWLDGPLGLTSLGGQQIITQIRIVIESLIVLFIMTGYREAIVKFFQKIFLLFQNPHKFVKSFKKTSPQNSWT